MELLIKVMYHDQSEHGNVKLRIKSNHISYLIINYIRQDMYAMISTYAIFFNDTFKTYFPFPFPFHQCTIAEW